MARHYPLSSLEGARRGYRAARGGLRGKQFRLMRSMLLERYRTEGFRLRDTARAVAAVERALRGGSPAWEARQGPR